VWSLHDGGALKLSLNTSRQKTKNLRQRPQCALFPLDLSNPYRYLAVRGRARVEPDDDYTFADKLGANYGSDLRQNDRPARAACRSRSSRRTRTPSTWAAQPQKPVGGQAGATSAPRPARSPRGCADRWRSGWLDVDVAQCGYCQPGQRAAATRVGAAIR
jgi:hypothetical protein